MAYDCFLDCDGIWEKIIFYAILHPGNSDTVGAIAAAFYGSVYGFGDVPENMLKYLENKNILNDMSNKFIEKYL